MNNTLRLFVFLAVLTLCFALPHGKCGTQRPAAVGGGPGKSIPACGNHECEDPAVRDQYLLGPDSKNITMRLNVVYFGVLANEDLIEYNAQMKYFQDEWAKFFKINWIINVTVVSDQYLIVDAEDDEGHFAIATEYYVPGAVTVIWTSFDPNPYYLLGYAYGPDVNFEGEPERFYTIMDIQNALGPKGTTIVHEVGHMFGLLHTFIEFCDSCTENENSPNRDIVGDFCNDTLPITMSYACDSLSDDISDCNGFEFTDLTNRPQNNFMSYTPDACMTTFTPLQAARARCYVDKELYRFVEPVPISVPVNSPVAAPSDVPNSGSTPGSNNAPGKTPGKTPGKVSAGSSAQAVLAIASLALFAL